MTAVVFGVGLLVGWLARGIKEYVRAESARLDDALTVKRPEPKPADAAKRMQHARDTQ